MDLINYWAVFLGGIFLFVVGWIWYGPIFGRVWMEIMGREKMMTSEEMKSAQAKMVPSYIVTFLLGLLTSYALYYFVKLIPDISGVYVAFWVWLGFMVPMAAGVMFEGRSRELAWKKFLITAGYQLITLLILGWAFTMY